MQPGRNEPCPCGSGRKYKKCCGAVSAGSGRSHAQHLRRAAEALSAGDFREAIRCCETLLVLDANNADANHIAGAACLRLGMWRDAERYLRLAADLQSSNPFILSNLAMACLEQGSLDDAERYCRAALALDPDLPDTRNSLGNVLRKKGEHERAVEEYRKAAALDPHEPLFRLNLGTALHEAGAVAEAETCYQFVIQSRPDFSEPIAKLGTLYLAGDRFDEAEALLRRSFALVPDPAVANNIGLCYLRSGKASEASEWFKKAITLDPRYTAAWSNLGLSLERTRDYTGAATAYKRALEIDPTLVGVKVNLIRVPTIQSDISGAHALALELLETDLTVPTVLPTIVNMLSLACDLERLERVLVIAKRYIQEGALQSRDVQALLLFFNYADTVEDRVVFDCHLRWAASIEPLQGERRGVSASKHAHKARLRIAYLSPDLRAHSVGFFMQHVIANHDPSRFEVYCYSSAASNDAVTNMIQRHASHYTVVDRLSDAELAGKIEEDRIDIAIDLAGHTTWSRVSALAYRPAPVQITYLGYPNTTGLSTIDFRISDPYVDPAEGVMYSEKLLRLPECFLCFGEFAHTAIDPAPVHMRAGGVTFGSFNVPAKLNRRTIALWAKILHAVPGSRLLLKYRGFQDPVVQEHVRQEFARVNLSADRLIFVGRVRSFEEHLQYYNQMDIALDPLPYNGTTTTCQALWMGVPVVTLVGQMHRARVSYTILKNIGVTDTVATDEDEYVKVAASLANDHARLERLRKDIPRRLRGSILCDPVRFTRQLEAAYRQARESMA